MKRSAFFSWQFANNECSVILFVIGKANLGILHCLLPPVLLAHMKAGSHMESTNTHNILKHNHQLHIIYLRYLLLYQELKHLPQHHLRLSTVKPILLQRQYFSPAFESCQRSLFILQSMTSGTLSQSNCHPYGQLRRQLFLQRNDSAEFF